MLVINGENIQECFWGLLGYVLGPQTNHQNPGYSRREQDPCRHVRRQIWREQEQKKIHSTDRASPEEKWRRSEQRLSAWQCKAFRFFASFLKKISEPSNSVRQGEERFLTVEEIFAGFKESKKTGHTSGLTDCLTDWLTASTLCCDVRSSKILVSLLYFFFSIISGKTSIYSQTYICIFDYISNL